MVFYNSAATSSGPSGEVLHRGDYAGEDQVVSGVCGEAQLLV